MSSLYLKTHIVRKGETLEGIAAVHGISDVEMLRYFHNQNAPKDSNHIGSFVTLGQEIFIPEKTDIERILQERKRYKENNKARETERLKNQALYPDFLRLNVGYLVKITHYFENKPDEKNSLDFRVHLKHTGAEGEGLPILQYRKEHYKINDREPELKLYGLAVQSANFLYPIEFSLGTPAIPYKITNLKEIDSRWKKTKEKINNTFADSHSKTYAEAMDRVMGKGLQKYIMRDLYLQFFFAPYAEYIGGKSDMQRRFQSRRIQYQDIMEMENVQDVITIKQNARCIAPGTQQQILSGENLENDPDEENTRLLESSILGEYHLDKQHKILQNAKVKIKTLFYGKDENIEIKIDRI